jgi:hypothetical protein
MLARSPEKIGELAGHEVDYLALTLDAAPYRDHAGSHHHVCFGFEQ